MFGGGRGPMGGGGGMLRAASRIMARAGVTNGGGITSSSSSPSHASVSHKLGSSSSSNNIKITAASGSPLNLPVAATAAWNGGFPFVSSGFYDDFEWVSEEELEEENDSVFGSVPSVDEVHDAVSAINQVFDGGGSYTHLARDRYESDEDGMDWFEPSMQLCYSRILQPHHRHHHYGAYDKVYNAFDLLRTEPAVQRMVVSLSSDKAVWEAVMNNEVVREIRELYNNGISEGTTDEFEDETSRKSKSAMDFIRWLFENTMVKATQVFEKITKVVTELFNTRNGVNRKGKDAKFNRWLEEKLKTSVLLSIVVLLVVMVSRACNRS